MNKHKIIKGIIRKDGSGKNKYLCVQCLKSGKGTNPCGISTHDKIRASYRIHFPSATASKTKWKQTLIAIGWVDWYVHNLYTISPDTIQRIKIMKKLFNNINLKIEDNNDKNGI